MTIVIQHSYMAHCYPTFSYDYCYPTCSHGFIVIQHAHMVSLLSHVLTCCIVIIHICYIVILQSLYDSIKKEPFKIPEDDGNDLMHTFFNPDKEGWLWKQGERGIQGHDLSYGVMTCHMGS